MPVHEGRQEPEEEDHAHTSFSAIFAKCLLSFVIILAVALLAVWHYRANIFDHFAREYMKEAGTLDAAGTSGQAVFSQQSFVVDAVKKANPAVVSIIISKNVPKYIIDPDSQRIDPFGDMFPGFDSFFNSPRYIQKGTELKEIGGGSGFLVVGRRPDRHQQACRRPVRRGILGIHQ